MYFKLTWAWMRELNKIYDYCYDEFRANRPIRAIVLIRFNHLLVIQFAVGVTFSAHFVDKHRNLCCHFRRYLMNIFNAFTQGAIQFYNTGWNFSQFTLCLNVCRNFLNDKSAVELAQPFHQNSVWMVRIRATQRDIHRLTPQTVGLDMNEADNTVA